MNDEEDMTDRSENRMDADLPFDFSVLNLLYVLDTIPVCVVFITPEGRFGYVSPQFYTLHRLPPDSKVIGTRVVDWLAQDEAPEVKRRMSVGPTENSYLKPTVLRLARADNSLFLAETTSVPLHAPDGRFVGLISVLREVTEAVVLEQRLLQNFERQEFLNHLLQLLYRPRDLMSALAQVMAMIGIFAGASRVSLMETSPDNGSACMTIEWNENEEDSALETPQADKFVCVEFAEAPSLRLLAEGRGVVCVPGEPSTPADLAALLEKWHLHGFLALPVFGVDHLYGLIMIEFAVKNRACEQEDLDLFRNISRTISNAVARRQVEEAEYAQRVLVETLRDITSVVNSDFTFDQVLEYILSNLHRIVPHTTSSILLLDDHGYLHAAHTHGFPPGKETILRNLYTPLNQWKTIERVSKSVTPIIVSDTLIEDNWEPVPEINWIRSYLGAAIRSRGKLLGILNVDANTADAFTAEHANRLQAFAEQAAVAIENAILYQEAQRRVDLMTTLYEIGLTLASGLNLDQVLTSLHDQVARVLPFDLFYVALYDESLDLLHFPLFIERGERVVVRDRSLVDSPGLSGVVITTRQTLYVHDGRSPDNMAHYQPQQLGSGNTRAYVGVPLIAREQVLGVMSMQSYQPGMFSQEQVRLLETIANQAALAIDNARIFKEMNLLAITDSLTGLYNRGHLSVLGQIEVERAVRYQRGLGVLMVDIDNFKRVNDSMGHISGDYVLAAVAQICRSQLRSSDIIGRYGGEEFGIVLPETSEERALRVAERMRELIAEAAIETPRGPVHVTVSVGLVLLGEELVTLETLLDRADMAMYRAKQAGRDRVELYKE